MDGSVLPAYTREAQTMPTDTTQTFQDRVMRYTVEARKAGEPTSGERFWICVAKAEANRGDTLAAMLGAVND